ncbi:iron/zinc/copper transport system permease protein [Pelagirhabdus alkalitolerans]|uniref:Manganese transport system membrane protein MntC n=1 Tax=Pelagirhabdus alkalitolerans TaxID=1612202 RepID=A0A1G6JHD4_9BACI|nr:metal ABC transporter permease [Pelagirhabdus alkalitolerans]SDC18212.1 iron/zinc/copper transport system permease protein [Pelagirhabdus alkalitolerans]
MIEQMTTFVDALSRYPFLQNAVLAGVLVGVLCGVVGTFIILRGMALMGEAISHAVLPGVVLSYILGATGFFAGAVLTGTIAALGIGYITENSKIKDDSAIGILLTGMFAIGIVMVTSLGGTNVDVWHILFGNVLAVSRTDLWITFVITIVVILSVLVFYKQLILSTFDPTMAKAIGLPTKWIHYILMIVLSLVTVVSLNTVGVILVVAMLITPASTAYLLTDRLPIMLVLSSTFGVISAVVGVYLSYIYDVATGASIVVVAMAIFTFVFFFSPKQGVAIQWFRRLSTGKV